MKGSQGLEALATLCGGQSDAPTDDTRAGNNLGATSCQSGPGATISCQEAAVPQDSSSQQGQRQPPSMAGYQSPLQNVTQQQWQQAIAAAAALQGNGVNPALAAQNFLLSGGLAPQQAMGDNAFSAMQQLAFQQYVQAQANLSAQQAAQSLTNSRDGQQAIMMALVAGKAQQQLQQVHGASQKTQQQVIPSAPQVTATTQATTPAAGVVATSTASATAGGSPILTSMKPPPPPSQATQSLSSTLSTAGIINKASQQQNHTTIAPMPGGKILPNSENVLVVAGSGDKKQQKRAANRRSAQLSRKRKKQFIEELKEENDELRRREQILRSIPDLIVVFDSSGKLGFVSESVSRFIDLAPEELEGTSFWDRLCEDSVRLLKAAFMDALAARKADSDTAPLGSGVWELRLMDKDSNYTIVTLNGVVHFSGEAPECVCCIRPFDQQPIQKLPATRATSVKSTVRAVSSSDFSRSSDGGDHLRMQVDPSQSVISNDTLVEDSVPSRKQPRRDIDDAPSANGRQAVRISDGDSGCEVSESGSDDITSN